MRVDSLDFDLPADRIAQRPVEPRDAARLLVLDPVAEGLTDAVMMDLADHLPSGALLIVNDTKVIRARLLGRKAETGGRVELLLVRRMETTVNPLARPDAAPAERWKALGKASKAFRFPAMVHVGDRLRAVVERRADDDGLLEVVLFDPQGGPVSDAIRGVGHVPLPPYIRREDDARDADEYQTVYARHEGAVAAPTAGLHLTHRLIGALAAREIRVATITLHVGPGTFQPVTVDDLDDHRMHEEWYEVPRFAAREIEEARGRGCPVVAVGTTTVRALEACADPAREGLVVPGSGHTRLLIQPGFRFRVVDALLTNFHLPRSTLLALVGALGGMRRIQHAYAHAIANQYRFFSYGDAMLIRSRAQHDRDEP